jgi:hypothetical protein
MIENLNNLLTDVSAVTIFELHEDKNNPGVFKGKGPFGKCGIATSNGRLYTRPVMEREIAKLQESIKQRKLYGELDHPGDGKTKLGRASHIITGLEIMEDGTIMGELEVIPTSNGKDLEAILSRGCSVDVSSRGFGTVKMSEGEGGKQVQIVQDDYNLKTYDVVVEGAAGEFARPTYKKEDKDDEGEKKDTVIKPEAPKPTEPKDNVEKELLDSLKEKVSSLEEKVRALENSNTKLEEELLIVADAARRAGYELFIERKLKDEENEVRNEIVELLGDIQKFETLAELKTRFDVVINRVKEYRSKIKESAEKKEEKVEAKKVAIVDDKDKQRKAFEEKLRERRENIEEAEAERHEEILEQEDSNELEYLDNISLQNYALEVAMSMGMSNQDFDKAENKLMLEAVRTTDEVDKILEQFHHVVEVKKDKVTDKKVEKVDKGAKSALFEDVSAGSKRKKITEEKASAAKSINDFVLKESADRHHASGMDVLGVSMGELKRISDEAKLKLSNKKE